MRVRSGAAPVSSADVSAGETAARTDVQGEVRLALPEGEYEIRVVRVGFLPAGARARVQAGEETVAAVQLREQRLESSVTVVSSTRSGTVMEDQPIRVEAVPREEIEENQTIAPGALTTLLNELGGLRVQTTSPALGGAELRLQGLRGRYSQILTDELPLLGGNPDALSLLQTPPLDLARVEVIKGTTSALYGGSALGGVMNLVSRRPGGESELLVNQTSRRGTDLVGFYPGEMRGRWGFTLLGSAHRQEEVDVDGDGWADLPGYRRAVLRPRLYWDDEAGHSLLATVGGMAENRNGGTVEGGTTPAGDAYAETLGTRRLDGGLVGNFLLGDTLLLTVHGSLERSSRGRTLGTTREDDVREAGFAEAALAGSAGGNTWVLGAALVQESLRVADLEDLDYSHVTPGLFLQDELAVSEKLSLAASGRVDTPRDHGTFFDPRLSVLVRPDRRLSVRISAGTGYALPVPLTGRTEEVGFSRVLPLAGVEPERAGSASLDVGWREGGLELDGTLFASRIDHALQTRASTVQPDKVEVVNAPGPTDARGAEFIAHYDRGPLHLIATYTYLRATEADPEGVARREVPLSPRHAAELAAILENESKGRIGAEISYTGTQSLEDNPYRSTGASYVEVSLLAEAALGDAHLFLNLQNLADVRQTRYDPLLLPARASDGRWTTDAWAPLEGRVVNLGCRFEF